MANSGLKLEHKLLIFFGGIFIIAFSGFGYFDSIPGSSKKEKTLAILLYYLGVLFWIGCFIAIVYLT